MSWFLMICMGLALLPQAGIARTLAPGVTTVHDAIGKALTMDSFFRTLQRPRSPNHWLVAPEGFAVKPDAAAPVFAVPATALRDAFKVVLRQTPGAAIATEADDGLHVVYTSAVFGFKDDIHVRVFPLSPQQSTLALYLASRVGYWDFGTNRRRVEDLISRIRA